jgi:hypothetical protein
MKRAALFSIISITLLLADSRADVLLLAGGGRIEGVVTEVADGYRVESLGGRATVPKDRVVGVVEAPYVTEIYAERREGLDRSDPEAVFRLALWCEGVGLEKEARLHLRETLLVDPDHLRARAKLGYVRYRGVWMTPEEAKQAAMAEAGLIPFEGKWFSEAGLRAYLEAKVEQARVEEAVAKARAEREKAELEAKAAEEELAKKKAERKAVEEALARLEADRRERDRLRREIDALRNLLYDAYYRGALGTGWGCATPAVAVPVGYGRRAWGRGRYDGGPRIGFEWDRGNLRVRGRIR